MRGEIDGYRMEKRFIRKDGQVIHALIAAQAIRKPDGRVDFFSAIVEDISERRQAEAQLAFQVARSAALLELPQQAEQLDEKAFMQLALEQAERLTSSQISFIHFVNDDGESIELVTWSRSTLAHYCQAAFDRHYPISQAGIWADAAREKAPVVINDYAGAGHKHGLPPGHSPLARLISIPIIEGEQVRMMIGVGNKTEDYHAIDVETAQLIGNATWRLVERRRNLNALRLAMQVVNASPVVCFRWANSEGWPVVFVSDNVRQWGYSPEQLQEGDPPFAHMIHPDDLARATTEMEQNMAARLDTFEQEYRIVTADDRVIWVVDRTKVRRNAEGEILYFDGVLTDISQRKAQQLAVAEHLARQQQLNKRLEEAHNQLLQSEKMASIGQLAAGVAHELNNPIGFVRSNLGTLEGYLRDLMAIIEVCDKVGAAGGEGCLQAKLLELVKQERDFDYVREDIFKLVGESKEGIARVSRIVQDLKSFSRVGEQEWKEADLHQGLDSTLNIVWNELKYKCQVVKEYGQLPPVFCLISQLNQVFMNLLVNAGQAIEKQGEITIRTRREGADSVCVEIEDTGKGIAPEHLNRIFEPFFTTKPVGKGTGLGLSLSYSIVERHHGRIEVDSTPGKGSRFRVILPVHPDLSPAELQTEAG